MTWLGFAQAELNIEKDKLEQKFSVWLAAFSQQAQSQGVTEQTIVNAFRTISYDRHVIALDRKQPEFTQSFDTYLSKRITALQIKRGKRRLLKYQSLFKQVSARYGVDKHVVAAIWGVESNFGTYLPRFKAIQTLATLSFDSRRSEYFQAELLAALQILDQGRLQPQLMTSSYSGALGQPQFMPTTYLQLAQDFDRDGFADIWKSELDVLASIAMYLKERGGWVLNIPWGAAVRLPQNFDFNAYKDKRQSLDVWLKMGLVLTDKTFLSQADTPIVLLVPERSEGAAFLVTENFEAVMEYNPSHFYTLAVCLLSDKLKE